MALLGGGTEPFDRFLLRLPAIRQIQVIMRTEKRLAFDVPRFRLLANRSDVLGFTADFHGKERAGTEQDAEQAKDHFLHQRESFFEHCHEALSE